MSETEVQGLQVGDLVKFGSVLRKVRAIAPSTPRARKPRRVGHAVFAKIKRSGYPSPVTIYYDCELRAKHVKLVKRGVRLRTTATERLLQRCVDERKYGVDSFITEKETVGLVV